MIEWTKINAAQTNLPEAGRFVLVFIESTERDPDKYWSKFGVDEIIEYEYGLDWKHFCRFGTSEITHYAYIEPPLLK